MNIGGEGVMVNYRTHPLQANFQKKLFNKNIIRLKLRAVVESQTVDTNLHQDGFCLSRQHRHVKKKTPGSNFGELQGVSWWSFADSLQLWKILGIPILDFVSFLSRTLSKFTPFHPLVYFHSLLCYYTTFSRHDTMQWVSYSRISFNGITLGFGPS